jgi:drug/metabolite transporter (DMT)-like permease
MNRPFVVIPLTIAVSFLVMLGQTAVKHGINNIPGGVTGWAAVASLLGNAWFLVGVGIGGVGTVTWMFVLARSDFSYALPLLTFCGMLIAMVSSRLLLHESLGPQRIVGTLLIAVGALLVARS